MQLGYRFLGLPFPYSLLFSNSFGGVVSLMVEYSLHIPGLIVVGFSRGCLYAGNQTAGVKVGYATMWDRSRKGYCTRSDAEVDTQRYLGQRLMAVGACPNYGKYIAFVDRTGKPVDDQDRFTNEIHGNTMPFSTQGCSSSASPGTSEVPMDKSGWSMYSGYLVKCPFNQAVYQNDMLQDGEYDPDVCRFVTLSNPLVFLDPSLPGTSLADKAYAFHGKGGHQGYDFIGNGVGCPPYSPPQKTRSMKSPNIANDPFLCSQLSRCTSMCWPWDMNRPCYRSLPAVFNHSTSECLILGYHTQTYMGSNCAVKTATDSNAKYCVKAHKTVASSNYTYVSAFTRPDYETACRKQQSWTSFPHSVIVLFAYSRIPFCNRIWQSNLRSCGVSMQKGQPQLSSFDVCVRGFTVASLQRRGSL